MLSRLVAGATVFTSVLWLLTYGACVVAAINGSREIPIFTFSIQDEDLQNGFQVGIPLTKHEFEKAARMPVEKTPVTKEQQDPLEAAGAFEGDIEGVNVTEMMIRNAVINPSELWPSGIVPYMIAKDFDEEERLRIAQAILQYHTKTCVRFVPWRNQNDYIFIVKGNGCTSQVGRKTGRQFLSLGRGCVHPGIIMHEMMHVLGFWHEQSRADRDENVIVNWINIARGMEYNFMKFTWGDIQGLGEPYDLGSVMHYGPFAFSRDGRAPTIVPRQAGIKIGQRDGFSGIDLRKINKLYMCGGIPTEVCADRHAMCQRWSSEGECKSNPLWMFVNCRASCGVCATLSACVDRHPRCSLWALFWQCQSNSDYMLNFCRKSCRAC